MTATTSPPLPALLDCVVVWQQLSPERQRRIGVAALIATLGLLGSNEVPEPPGWTAAQMAGEAALREMLRQFLSPRELSCRPDLRALGLRSCRACGCTDQVGCEQGCGWAAEWHPARPDFCTACIDGARQRRDG